MILPSLSQQCLEGFALLNTKIPSDEHTQKQTLAECFSIYKTWVGNARPGTIRQSTSPLTELLRDNQQLHSRLVRLLTKLSLLLCEALKVNDQDWDTDTDSSADSNATEKAVPKEDLPELEPIDSPLNRTLKRIRRTVDSLCRLSIAIRVPARHDQLVQGDLIPPERFQAHDLEQVKLHFPKAKPFLVERLAAAISKRRQYFQYRANKLAGVTPDEFQAWPDDLGADLVGPIMEPGVVITPFEVTPGDMLVPKLSGLSSADSSSGIVCPICYGQYWTKDIQFWKSHISQDMTPYLCTSDSCVVSSRMYSDRRAWQYHEETKHHRKWQCPFECPSNFDLETLLEDHLVAVHQVPEDPDALQMIAQASSQSDQSKWSERCPLCDGVQQSVTAWYVHVGEHLIQLSMFSLPRDLTEVLYEDDLRSDDDDDDEEDQDEDDDEEDQDEDDESNMESSVAESLGLVDAIEDPSLEVNGSETPDLQVPKLHMKQSRGALSTIPEESSIMPSDDGTSHQDTPELSSNRSSTTRFFDSNGHIPGPEPHEGLHPVQGNRYQHMQRPKTDDHGFAKTENGRAESTPERPYSKSERKNKPHLDESRKAALASVIEDPTHGSRLPRKFSPSGNDDDEATAADRETRPAVEPRVDQHTTLPPSLVADYEANLLRYLPVKLSLAPGFWYKMPFKSVQTWEGMLRIINEAYRYSPTHQEMIAHDRFDILDEDGSTVLPSFWQSAVQPGSELSIRFGQRLPDYLRPPKGYPHFDNVGRAWPPMQEPVIPLEFPFGEKPVNKSSATPGTKTGKEAKVPPSETRRSDDSKGIRANAKTSSQSHPTEGNPRLLDHQYRGSDSDGYYPDLVTATDGAYTRPMPQRRETNDIGDLVDRIVLLDDQSVYSSRPQSIQRPLVVESWDRSYPVAPRRGGEPASSSFSGTTKGFSANSGLRFSDGGHTAPAVISARASSDAPSLSRRRSTRYGASTNATGSTKAATVSGASDYSHAIVEDSRGTRTVILTKEDEARLRNEHEKRKLKDSLQEERAAAYQKEMSGRQDGHELTAESVKSSNRKSGSQNPPSYVEVDSTTGAEVGSTRDRLDKTAQDEDTDDWGTFAMSAKEKKSKKKKKTKEQKADTSEPSQPEYEAEYQPRSTSSKHPSDDKIVASSSRTAPESIQTGDRDPSTSTSTSKKQVPEVASVTTPITEDEEPD